MVYICPGGNCTGIAIFFFDKVSHLKHPSVHCINTNTKGEERFHLGMPCSLPTCSTHFDSMPSLASSLLPGFSHQAGSTCEENRLRAELENQDKYANYLQDLSSFINAVQRVSVGS